MNIEKLKSQGYGTETARAMVQAFKQYDAARDVAAELNLPVTVESILGLAQLIAINELTGALAAK